MSAFICLIIGLILGGCVGFCIIACMQINRINYYENEIEKLKQKLNTKY